MASLLVLHDLHPEDTTTRITRALETVRDHPVEAVGFDDATATLRVRSTGGSGCGCPSTGRRPGAPSRTPSRASRRR